MADPAHSPPVWTAARRDALRRAAAGPLYRVRDGWRGRGQAKRIRLDTAEPLVAAGYLARRTVKGHVALVLTQDGAEALKRSEAK